MAAPARTDAETLKVLESVKPTYERLRDERIRTDAEIARCERDHREAEARAMEVFGTSDLDEIRRQIEERRSANATRVDDYAAEVRQIAADLAGLDA